MDASKWLRIRRGFRSSMSSSMTRMQSAGTRACSLPSRSHTAVHSTFNSRICRSFSRCSTTKRCLQRLADHCALTWQGKGDLRAPQHTGDALIELAAGQFGDLKDLSARATASYSPQFINVPELRATAEKYGEAMLSLFWKDNRLSLSNLSVRQKKLTLIEGSAGNSAASRRGEAT